MEVQSYSRLARLRALNEQRKGKTRVRGLAPSCLEALAWLAQYRVHDLDV